MTEEQLPGVKEIVSKELMEAVVQLAGSVTEGTLVMTEDMRKMLLVLEILRVR